MADDPPLPDWLNDNLTHDKLLEQCYRRKADWLLPENGGVYCAGDKIRELKAGLTILRIASPTTPVLRDGLVEQLKGSAADNRKLFDDFHASLDLIVTAIKNVMPAAPSSGAKPVKRRQSKRRKSSIESSLTGKQLEAMQIVGECKGDLAEAARRMGKDRSTIKQHYDAATAKLGKRPVKHSTKRHATDRRGQADIATDADKRL